MSAVSMKLMPASRDLFMIANEVDSSAPTPCMNEFSSASPKVMAPRHRVETFRPLFPRLRYCMAPSVPCDRLDLTEGPDPAFQWVSGHSHVRCRGIAGVRSAV